MTQGILVFAATSLSAGLAALYLWPRNRGFSYWGWGWCALLSAGLFFPSAEYIPWLAALGDLGSTLFAVFMFVGTLHYAGLTPPRWLLPFALCSVVAETGCVVAGFPHVSHLASLPLELTAMFGAARAVWKPVGGLTPRVPGEDSLGKLLAIGFVVLGVMLAVDAFGDYRQGRDALHVAQWITVCIPFALIQITFVIDRLTLATRRENRARRDAVTAAKAYRQRVNLLSEELTAGNQRTRRELAMALHDGVCQDLAATQFILETGARGGSNVDVSLLKEAIGRANESARRLLAEVGSQAWSGESIEQFASARLEALEAELGVAYELDVNVDGRLSDTVRVTLTRALWELLANVRKHSHADLVMVRIWTLDERVWFSVADDGTGFDNSETGPGGHGFGLWSLRQQLERLGGGLRVTSMRGEGTQVRGWLPCGDEVEVQLELLDAEEFDYSGSA